MLRWAEWHIAEHGRAVARLDAVRTNEALQQWYAARGYQLVGFREFGCCSYESALREKRLDSARPASLPLEPPINEEDVRHRANVLGGGSTSGEKAREEQRNENQR